MPGVGDPLLDLESKDWFLLSDVAGILRGLLTGRLAAHRHRDPARPAPYFVLWRTAFGLRLRSCGESPVAAESLGVNVYLMKYAARGRLRRARRPRRRVPAMVAGNGYREGQTGGRGFIGLAAMIFGNWRPGGLAAGAGLFGYTDALQLRRGGESVHALLLLVGVAADRSPRSGWRPQRLLVGGRLRGGRRGAPRAGTSLTDEVPGEFTRSRRTSPRCWCWPWRPNGCGCPPPTACRTGEARVADGRPRSTGPRCAGGHRR